MMSNKGLNSKEALDESTATNSSVTLSGIRREKEAPTDLDITHYSRNPGKSHRGRDLTADYADLPGSKNAGSKESRRRTGVSRLRAAGAGLRRAKEITGQRQLAAQWLAKRLRQFRRQ